MHVLLSAHILIRMQLQLHANQLRQAICFRMPTLQCIFSCHAHGAAAVKERFPEPSEAILQVRTDPNPRGRQHVNRPVVGLTGARYGGAAGRRCRTAADPPETDDAVAAGDHRRDQVVGLTGGWFPAVLSRWRDAGGEQLQQIRQRQEQNPEQAAQATGAQRTNGQRQAIAQSDITAPKSESDWVGRADWSTLRKTSKLVRPYSWTGGRTTSPVNLEVETLVSATGRPADPAGPAEHRTILGLCATPRSVAELAALLKMPLGVTRVLLGDLAAADNVAVHRTADPANTAADIALMQRVITGLQRL